MNVIKTDIDGVFVIKPTIFEDSRGYSCGSPLISCRLA